MLSILPEPDSPSARCDPAQLTQPQLLQRLHFAEEQVRQLRSTMRSQQKQLDELRDVHEEMVSDASRTFPCYSVQMKNQDGLVLENQRLHALVSEVRGQNNALLARVKKMAKERQTLNQALKRARGMLAQEEAVDKESEDSDDESSVFESTVGARMKSTIGQVPKGMGARASSTHRQSVIIGGVKGPPEITYQRFVGVMNSLWKATTPQALLGEVVSVVSRVLGHAITTVFLCEDFVKRLDNLPTGGLPVFYLSNKVTLQAFRKENETRDKDDAPRFKDLQMPFRQRQVIAVSIVEPGSKAVLGIIQCVRLGGEQEDDYGNPLDHARASVKDPSMRRQSQITPRMPMGARQSNAGPRFGSRIGDLSGHRQSVSGPKHSVTSHDIHAQDYHPDSGRRQSQAHVMQPQGWADRDLTSLQLIGTVVGGILEMMQTEAGLRISRLRCVSAFETVDAVCRAKSLVDLEQRLKNAFQGFFKVKYVRLLFYDHEENVLLQSSQGGENNSSRRKNAQKFALKGIVGLAVRKKQVMRVPRISANPYIDVEVDGLDRFGRLHPEAAMLAAPLLHEQDDQCKVVGVVQLMDKRKKQGLGPVPFDDDDEVLLKRMGNIIGTAAHLSTEVRRLKTKGAGTDLGLASML